MRSFSETLSEKDTVELSQKIPIIRTSFAWPLKLLNGLGDAKNEEPQDDNPTKSLELIRNGNISVLHNSNQSVYSAPNTGGPDVQR